jgi:hypothetical protein
MSLFVRTLVLCVLALALPMQGLAAATMQHCGSNHHARTAAAPKVHDHAAHGHADHQGHGAMTADHHHAAPGTTDVAADTGDDQVSNYLNASSVVTAKCSACASCCSALALPATIAQIAVVQQHASRFPPLALEFGPVVTDSLERPPRSSLA